MFQLLHCDSDQSQNATSTSDSDSVRSIPEQASGSSVCEILPSSSGTPAQSASPVRVADSIVTVIDSCNTGCCNSKNAECNVIPMSLIPCQPKESAYPKVTRKTQGKKCRQFCPT